MHCLLPFTGALLSATVSAHMCMIQPPSIRWKGNPYTLPGKENYDIKAPLQADGSNFPCQGYTKLFNTTEGSSVESWEAGSTQIFIVNGTIPHNGGTCQVSISEDNGVTFKAIKTFIGSCPGMGRTAHSFNVPKEAKPGKVIFTWTWFSNTRANPEMYMNCAAVTITGPGGNGLSAYPDMFVADVGNGCITPEGDIVVPNPGKDVERAPSNSLVSPVGGSACLPATTLTASSSSSNVSASSSNVSASTSTAPASRGFAAATLGSSSRTTSAGAAASSTSAANISSTPAGIVGPVVLAVLFAIFSLFPGC